METKYLKGWLKYDDLKDLETFLGLLKSAKESEENNKELVIFEIPKDYNIISDIEMFLQQKLG